MKIDFNRQDDLNARITLVIEYADYGPKLDENIKKYSKKIALKGFRSGKTPKSVLTKMYGKGMLEETVNGLLNEKLFGYLEEQKIDIFGSPVLADDAPPVNFNTKSNEDYTFVFELGLKPDFELSYGNESPIDIVVPAIDEARLDEDIIRYRRVFGDAVLVTEGVIESHDRVELRLARITEDGSHQEVDEETSVDLERVNGKAAEMLPGLKTGDVMDVDLEEFLGYERSVIVKNTLHSDTDPAPGQPLQYTVTITAIHRPQTTELSGEQLTKFTGKQLENESEFREFLVKREADNIASQATDMKKMAIRSALLKANPFRIPEAFLLKWVNQQQEKKLEEGSREAGNLFRDATWSLLLNRIASGEGLEVTEKDIQRQVTNWVVQNVNYMQTDIKKLMGRLYKNEYFMSTMKENALEEVVFGHILPKYQFSETEVEPSRFEKEFHDLHHELFDHGDHDGHTHEHSHDHHEHSHG